MSESMMYKLGRSAIQKGGERLLRYGAKRARTAASRYARSTFVPVVAETTSGKVLYTGKLNRPFMSMGETKGLDTNIEDAIITTDLATNGDILPLNLIQQGAGSFNRVGRKAHLKSVRCRGIIQSKYKPNPVTGDVKGTSVRLTLVWDKQPSGILPTYGEIFGCTNQAGVESSGFTDSVRYDNMDRFSVIKDVVISLNPIAANFAVGTSNFNVQNCEFDFYVPLKGRETVFSGSSVPMTIADISTGALYFVSRASEQAIEWQAGIIHAQARLRYTD